jgi:hypothetical protein
VRPKIAVDVEALVVRMAEENRAWGYDRIQGAMANPGHDLAAHTIANILKRNGIDPAPERKRKTTWKEFLSRHAEQIVATDFFAIEVWTNRGLQRFMVLFFIEVASRRVQLGGIARRPIIFFFGEDALRTAVREYLAHYHAERNHQGLGNRLITPLKTSAQPTGTVRRNERLGVTLSYYYRDVA